MNEQAEKSHVLVEQEGEWKEKNFTDLQSGDHFKLIDGVKHWIADEWKAETYVADSAPYRGKQGYFMIDIKEE